MSKCKLFFPAILSAICVLMGCASSKHATDDELNFFGRAYQNTTARYNGYYAAKMKMTAAEKNMITSRHYDYEKLLPLYITGNDSDAITAADMDSSIKKLTVDAKLHPQSKWADDCYFNIGKAYFYEKNYESALQVFQYVSSEYKEGTSTAKKKHHHGKPQSASQKLQDQINAKPKKSIFNKLKHQPARNENNLWMVRSFIHLNKYGEAQAILSYLDNVPDFPKNLQQQLQLVHTDLLLKEQNFSGALEPLKKAIDLTKNKKEKTRLTYLLAQLYQNTQQNQLAADAFNEVTRLKPSYEMDFYARMSLAKNYASSGSAVSAKEVIQKLEQMAHDDKYEEFYDQIYYTIAEIQLTQGNEEDAVKSLETSIDKSISNTNQKGLSFLKIGELDFDAKDYQAAQPNYDSAMVFLSSQYETIDDVKSREKILDNLAKQIRIIVTQDSLQDLARMDEKERDKIIDNLLDQYQKQQEQSAGDSLLNSNASKEQSNTSSQSSSGWYFYNTALKSTGFNEYKKVWGSRNLEDNWRRSDKSSSIESSETTTNDSTDEEETVSTSGAMTREKLLANVPLTPEKLMASNNKIFNAYNTLGTIYKNDLHDYDKAIETFEKIVSKFSDRTDLASVYYNLYLLYNEEKNAVKAEEYRQLILKDYPTSAYAGVINDPDYFSKQQTQKEEVYTYYASTFNFYEQENFSEVMNRVEAADSMFKSNPIQAKFDLLEAFAIGKTTSKEKYIAALDTVVKKYPQGEEHDKALEILTLLGVVSTKQEPSTNTSKNSTTLFVAHPNNPHYFVVYVPSLSPKAKAVSDSLANYNTLNHSLNNLKVSSQLLDSKKQLVLVKQFKNQEEAMNYYNEMLSWSALDNIFVDDPYDTFVIDDKNYITLFQKKNIDDYISFFEQNY